MPTKKKTSSNNTRSTKKTTRKPTVQEVQRVEAFRVEIILWVVIACGLLLFVSNFGVGGIVGNAVSRFLFGVFGLIAYVFPIILMIGCFFAVSNRDNIFAILKLVAAGLFTVFLCLFMALVASGKTIMTPIEAYEYSFNHKAGGGIIGGFLAYYLCNALISVLPPI